MTRWLIILLALYLGLLQITPLMAQRVHASPPLPTGLLGVDRTLSVGESDILDFQGISTAAVGNPLIVDIVPLNGHRLLVIAKGVGETTLFVYDQRGKHRLLLKVVPPEANLGPIAARIQAEIGLPGVTARAIQDTVFLEGSVNGVVALQRATAIAGVYTPRVKNLIAVVPASTDIEAISLAQIYATLLTGSLQQIGVKVQVVDDKTIALLGDYPLSPGNDAAEVSAKPVPASHAHESSAAQDAPDEDVMTMSLTDSTPRRSEVSLRSDPLQRVIQSLPPELTVVNLLNITPHPARQILVRAKIIDINRNSAQSLGVRWGTLNPVSSRSGTGYDFQTQPILFGQSPHVLYPSPLGGGNLERISPFAAQLNLLINENKARILSEPSLMVLDGNSGSILVGGEIPVPVAQGSSGTNGVNSSVTIEYKPYGVRLLVNASLVGERAIQLTVTPEVSELNYTNAVQISGFTIPALTVRRATSTLQMDDGETLVIGGLYSTTTSREVERIPLLSQIPVLGEFFKSTTTRKEESELLILLQPQIVTPNTPGAHPAQKGDPSK